jgi:thiol:disulfide interchange protein DsbD
LKFFLKSIWLFFAIIYSLTSFAQGNNTLIEQQLNEDTFLEADEAFKVSVTEVQGSGVNVKFKISNGYYIYKKRIEVKASKPFQISKISFPKAEVKNDSNFGISEIYHRELILPISIHSSKKTTSEVNLEIAFQGCSEKGLCYPPVIKTFKLDLKPSDIKSIKESNENFNSDFHENDFFGSKNILTIVASFFGLGLLLSLTPCVYPMIPILSGIIVGQKDLTNHRGSFELSVAYTLGMSLSYTIAGIIAALTGGMVSASLQNPWVLSSFSILIVTLAFSMFGLYELQIPTKFGTFLTNYTNRIKGGRLLGVFFMGAISALILSPCVAAPLAGALIYISKTHDLLIGGAALFSLSLGMGVPLLILGASAGAILPKAGKWMNVVKNFFGIAMLFMAIWILEPVIPKQIASILYASLIIVCSVYLGAFNTINDNTENLNKLKKGFSILVFVFGLILLLSSLDRKNNLTDGLNKEKNFSPVNQGLVFKKIKNVEDLKFEINKSKGSPVMLDFYAEWCSACMEYEKKVFNDPLVVNNLKKVVLLQVDATSYTEEDKSLLRKFKMFGPPGIVLFDVNGMEVLKITGYQNAKEFNRTISRVILSN